MLVSRDELHRGLTTLIRRPRSQTDQSSPKRRVARSRHRALSWVGRPIALYAERAVDATGGEVQPIFPGTEHGRATGAGVPPVVHVRGLIAWAQCVEPDHGAEMLERFRRVEGAVGPLSCGRICGH